MIPVLTKEEACKLDKDTIESGHLSQEELMDNAGKAVAQFFCEKIDNPFNQKVVVVCGKGNNGGDGVIAYSYLKKYNVSSEIVFTEDKHGHSKLLKKYKVSKTEYSIYDDKTKFDKYDWIIDAIFGIGLSRYLNDKYETIVENLNQNKNIISIDINSGLSSNTDEYKCYVNSKHVITFGYPKLGHYLNSINNLQIVNIGFKDIENSNICKIEINDIFKIIKSFNLNKDIHKYLKRCQIYAGSNAYPGAAILSARAAKKTGSGYVNLFVDCDKNLLNNLDVQLPEVVVKHSELIPGAPNSENEQCWLIGPGGTTLASFNDVHPYYYGLRAEPWVKFVIDASAITHISQNLDDYSKVSEDPAGCSFVNIDELKSPFELIPPGSIMTPHLGEFKKFFQIAEHEPITSSVLNNIQSIIKETHKIDMDSSSLNIVILKSFNTFIITKKQIYIMDKGPSILATAGTGDVLSGILVSLLSQGYTRLQASILGTYLHAEAANYYMDNISKDGMTASDLIDCIPFAFNKLREQSVN